MRKFNIQKLNIRKIKIQNRLAFRRVCFHMEITLKDCGLAILRHVLPILLVSVFVFVVVFAYFSANVETSYSYEVTFSNTTVDVLPPETVTGTSYAIHTYLVTVIPTQIDLLDTETFFALVAQDSAVKALGENKYTKQTLQKMVTFSQPDEEVANFHAKIAASSNADSKVLSEAIAKYVPQYLKQCGHGNGNKAIGEPAGPKKSVTNPFTQGIKGFIIIAVLMCAVFVVREALDTRIKNEKVITTNLKIPVLGSVPSFSVDKKLKGSDK